MESSMTREEAIEIIKKMYKGEPTKKQKAALEIAYHDIGLHIKKEVSGRTFKSDGKYHFICPHCKALLQPASSEAVCRFCGGELSWKGQIAAGRVALK